ncbi:HCNGP-like protein-domain-containing protein [Immersiella caudata]|uniref:HCNGP-like protein-domain-containing protein n=1 Tax=Immersiella caudata TaxID=314043 RepID=A0AA39XGA8_9PEZI|nr:HCNGP-like protein-domain-containing protein [Immersiella caudata]
MGLVQYESSDEDEDVQIEDAAPPSASPPKTILSQQPQDAPKPQPPVSSTPSQPISQPQPPSEPVLGPVQGPTIGPSRPPPSSHSPEADPMAFLSDPNPSTDPPRSPYTTARLLTRDLTLPAVPSMEIPPSPPPTQHADITPLTLKFTNFLALKRRPNDPAHFNSRLGASSALRNPALMDKLLDFVGIETEFVQGDGSGTVQYRSTVGAEVWDPEGFPEWAYRGALRRAQEEARKERERGRGEAVDFVSAGVGTTGVEGGAGAAPVRNGRRTMFDT